MRGFTPDRSLSVTARAHAGAAEDYARTMISESERERRATQRAMSIAEFCECYGVGKTKAYEELKYGRLRARKVGKRTIIAEDDAEDWLRRLPTMNEAMEALG